VHKRVQKPSERARLFEISKGEIGREDVYKSEKGVSKRGCFPRPIGQWKLQRSQEQKGKGGEKKKRLGSFVRREQSQGKAMGIEKTVPGGRRGKGCCGTFCCCVGVFFLGLFLGCGFFGDWFWVVMGGGI